MVKKNWKSFIELAMIFEEYLGLSLDKVQFYQNKPANIRLSSVSVIVSCVILVILIHSLKVTMSHITERNAIEAIFYNNLDFVIRPVILTNQIVVTFTPFMTRWILFPKWRQIYNMVLMKVPQRLSCFKIGNNWFIDGFFIIIVVALVVQSLFVMYFIGALTTIAQRYRDFSEAHWEQAVIFVPFVYRLTVGQLLLRLNIVVKEFKMVEKELNQLKVKFQGSSTSRRRLTRMKETIA